MRWREAYLQCVAPAVSTFPCHHRRRSRQRRDASWLCCCHERRETSTQSIFGHPADREECGGRRPRNEDVSTQSPPVATVKFCDPAFKNKG